MITKAELIFLDNEVDDILFSPNYIKQCHQILENGSPNTVTLNALVTAMNGYRNGSLDIPILGYAQIANDFHVLRSKIDFGLNMWPQLDEIARSHIDPVVNLTAQVIYYGAKQLSKLTELWKIYPPGRDELVQYILNNVDVGTLRSS